MMKKLLYILPAILLTIGLLVSCGDGAGGGKGRGEPLYFYNKELPAPISLSAGNYVAREVPMKEIASIINRTSAPFASIFPNGKASIGTDCLLHLDYGVPPKAFRVTLEDAFSEIWDNVKEGISGDTEIFTFDSFNYDAKVGDCTPAFYKAIGMPAEEYVDINPEKIMGTAMLIKIDHSSIKTGDFRIAFYAWVSADTRINYTHKEEVAGVERTTKYNFNFKAGWNEVFFRAFARNEEFTSTPYAGHEYKWTITDRSIFM